MNLRELKRLVPWPVKIGAKIVLARLPVRYNAWRRLQLFRHGAMTDPGYAEEVFRVHAAHWPAGTAPTILELGPGDSLYSALLGFRAGAARTWLVDVGPFATPDIALYGRAAEQYGLAHRDWASIEEMLAEVRGEYRTKGIESLREIPDGSVDFIWSHAVLEHVRRAEFAATARELARILRRGGRMSHLVDFKDHLGGALNSLRFSEARWEGDLLSSSGFYTNRLRLSEVQRLFEEAGFAVTIHTRNQWARLPTPRSRLAHEFAGFADQDLLTSEAHLLMRAA